MRKGDICGKNLRSFSLNTYLLSTASNGHLKGIREHFVRWWMRWNAPSHLPSRQQPCSRSIWLKEHRRSLVMLRMQYRHRHKMIGRIHGKCLPISRRRQCRLLIIRAGKKKSRRAAKFHDQQAFAQHSFDAVEPTLWSEDALRPTLYVSRGEWKEALPYARRRSGIRCPSRQQECIEKRSVHTRANFTTPATA